MLGSQRREDAALLVSELVTNALVHGIGTITLRIDVEPAALRVEVSDEGNVALAPSPTPGAHGGWGLRIVDQLADEWGVLAGSTKVWFRLGEPR
jgi:anti-sigma regulatory factor (Ser/Thr protein kinase)